MLLYDEIMTLNVNNDKSGSATHSYVINGILKSSDLVSYYSSDDNYSTVLQGRLSEFIPLMIDEIRAGNLVVYKLPKLKTCREFKQVDTKSNVSPDMTIYMQLRESILQFYNACCTRINKQKGLLDSFFKYDIDKKYCVVVVPECDNIVTFVSKRTNYVNELVRPENRITQTYLLQAMPDQLDIMLEDFFQNKPVGRRRAK
jgi:hypothetical protein